MPHRYALSLLLALFALIPLAASARDWQVDAAKSSLTFSGNYQDGPFHGRFGKFDAKITFDEADPSKDRFVVVIHMASVRTESAERDDTLKTPEFFNTVEFPTAHFATQSFSRNGAGELEAKGSLTIRTITKPVTLKVKFVGHGNTATLDVDTTLNRFDFDLGASDDWADISKDVPVHGHLLLTAK